MRKVVEDVKLFHEVAGQQIGDPRDPQVPQIESPRIGRILRDAERHLGYAVVDLKSLPEVSSSDQLLALRARLVLEETKEFVDALERGDTVQVADAIVDLIYVLTGTSIAFGIDQAMVWDAVAQANAEKFPPCESCDATGTVSGSTCETCRGHGQVALRDAGGKVIKPPGWTPPDVGEVLDRQRSTNVSS